MRAIIDCNSFYCSCERLFLPALDDKPVVVLSNNDGCIISRSDEAKASGVAMAVPYFMAKPIIEEFNVATFSSNYNLYGDLSWRVMETLRILLGPENVEVYSVDEAFLELPGTGDWQATAMRIRNTVELWTGIKVSIGVAPTKVLAKVANHLAKKNKIATQCVVVLDTAPAIKEALVNTPIHEVWGVGRQYAEKLTNGGAIFTAYDLIQKNENWARTHLGGVVGVRLLKELKGEAARPMETASLRKKTIATTRMFGKPASNLADVKEAVATYTARAAEKLRRQSCAANTVNVFIVPKEKTTTDRFRHGPTINCYTTMHTATSDSAVLIKAAIKIVEQLFEKGRIYKKAGVVLSDLVPDSTVQANLFAGNQVQGKKKLMEMIDNMNFAMRDEVVKFAATGTKKNWRMRQDLRSPRYTTRWDEICQVQ